MTTIAITAPTTPPSARDIRWASAMIAGRQGDRAAYAGLLKDVAVVLRKLVRYRFLQQGLGADDAEDLVQEVLIAVHIKGHTWDPERPFTPWLYSILRYKFIDRMRQIRREASYRSDTPIDLLADEIEAPAADIDRSLSRIGRHLTALSPGQQDVVRAMAIEGASVRETAQRLKTSEGVIRVMFHRALRKLKSACDPVDMRIGA